MIFETLYKNSSVGKIQEWDITVAEVSGNGVIEVEWGQQGGAKQVKETVITEGKNLGKANETTPYEQACSEAQSKWNKQVDKGYMLSIDRVSVGAKVLRPMLAQRYDKHSKKITFPCYIQPKLDGVRCISNAGLESRKGKKFNSVPHIQNAVDKTGVEGLDGELYVHGSSFQALSGHIRRDRVTDESSSCEYHVYDIVDPSLDFEDRLAILKEIEYEWPIVSVATVEVLSSAELMIHHNIFLSLGYEGSIVRNKLGTYEIDKRSYNLQKIKEFVDREFEIVGGKEDKNGRCVFECYIPEIDDTFDAPPEGGHELGAKYWAELPTLIGKELTVRFFEYTDGGVPRFPVGVSIRDYE